MTAKQKARAAEVAARIEATLADPRKQSMAPFFRGDLRAIAEAIRELEKRDRAQAAAIAAAKRARP